LNILIVGHACSPRRGSELAFTWNWAWHMSQRYQVWVLTHPQERQSIEDYLAEHPNPNLRFVFVNVPRWLDTWDPARDKRVSPLHYVLWQRAALHQASRLHKQISFDIVHHVSWGTVSEPPLLWRLPVPFVWGPVGGGQVTPAAFRKYLGSAARAEWMRDIRMRMIPFRPVLRKAARRSAVIFATNFETATILKQAGASDVKLFLDTGIREDFLLNEPPRRAPREPLKLLWVGRLLPRKCLPLAIEALAQLKDAPVRLLVAGKGEMRSQCEEMAAALGISNRIEFLGEVPYEGMPALYCSADAFIFTSIRDAFGSQVLEAMASGLPIIALNHQGVRAFVPDDAGIKVPVMAPRETVGMLAQAICTIARSVELRNRMGRAAWEFARTQAWPQRAQAMAHHYEEAIDQRRNPLRTAPTGVQDRRTELEPEGGPHGENENACKIFI
jgi:glycosyltransferase involved in cell wall biosynthesis